MCCLKCPEGICWGWTESIVGLRSTKLISSHSPHNNLQDVLGKVATSKPQWTHNSCLFPQNHRSKWHLPTSVHVQWGHSLPRRHPGVLSPGCPWCGAGASGTKALAGLWVVAKLGASQSTRASQLSLGPSGPWLGWAACTPHGQVCSPGSFYELSAVVAGKWSPLPAKVTPGEHLGCNSVITFAPSCEWELAGV